MAKSNLKAKSSKSNSTDASAAIGRLADAFELSLSPNIVNPVAHTQMEAAMAVMDDDNGLDVMQKAKLIKIFAKEEALAEMYIVIRWDKPVMTSFLADALSIPAPSSSWNIFQVVVALYLLSYMFVPPLSHL